WWQETILLAMSMPGMFGPFVRALIRLGRLPEQVSLVRECLNETIELDAAPFVELLDAAIVQMGKPASGLFAWLSRRLEGPAPDLTPAVRAALVLAQGRSLPGIEDRARKLESHRDEGVRAAARTLVGGPVAEEVTAPAAAGRVWREPLTGMSFVRVPPGRF